MFGVKAVKQPDIHVGHYWLSLLHLKFRAALNQKIYKSPGIIHISAEINQAGGETLGSEVHTVINLFCL